MSMTYENIRDMFYSMLGDDASNPTWFSHDQAAIFANKAIRAINQNNKIVRKKAVILPEAGVQEYDLPADCREVYRVTYDGTRIDPVTKSRLDADDVYWRSHTGTPFVYYLDRSNNKIGLYPVPSAGVSLASFTSEYGVAVPTSGTADSEYGFLVDPSFAEPLDITAEYGLYGPAISGNALEVFYWAQPEAVAIENTMDIPSWAVHYVLYSMLADAYSVGMPEPDYDVAQVYAAMAMDQMDRVRRRSSVVVNKVWKRQSGRYDRRKYDIRRRYPRLITDA